MLDRRPVLHTIILQARSAWTCIFSSQLVWMSFHGNQIFCAIMMMCISQHGLRIPSAESTQFCAGQLYIVPDRRQAAQRFAQRGFSGLFQHISLQGLSASWEWLSWHTARLGQLQQTLRDEHLDVALRQGSPADGVHRGGWKNQEWKCQREQDQGSWDEEEEQRTGRVWDCLLQCRMNRQSMISFMISMFMISM